MVMTAIKRSIVNCSMLSLTFIVTCHCVLAIGELSVSYFQPRQKNVGGNFHRHVHCLLLKTVKMFYSGYNMSVEISTDMSTVCYQKR